MRNSNKTKYLILGLLKEAPLSGYDIKKIVDLRFKYFWSESYGQIYPQLNKMNSEGIIRKIEDKQVDGRNRCKYEITPSGSEELKKWLLNPVEKESTRFEILLKLYFSDASSTDAMIENIKEFQAEHRKQQRMFTIFQKDLEKHLDLHDNHSDALMVILFGQKVWAAYDEWCEEALKLLKKQRENNKHE